MKPNGNAIFYNPLEAGLPVNVDAERIVLGRILLDGEMFAAVRDSLKAEDFSTAAHQTLFRRMAAIADAGVLPDRTFVAHALMDHGELEAVGGLAYLSESLDVPRIGIGGHIAIVKDRSVRRTGILRLNAALQRLSSAEDESSDVIAALEKDLGELSAELAGDSGFVTPRDVIERAGGLEKYLTRHDRCGVTLPWQRLNQLTGGLKPGQLNIVAALTSKGKTAFALNVARHLAGRDIAVAIFSQEMQDDELTDRFLIAETGLDIYQLGQSVENTTTRSIVLRGANRIGSLPIYIDDRDTATVPAIRARTRKLMARNPIGLVIVDYLQLVYGTGKFDTRQNEVASVSRGLKRLAKELRIPVMALSQLNRDSAKDNRRPELRDLRDSGSIEHDANKVLFLHCTSMWDMSPPVMNPFGEFACIVAKNRGGSIGDIPMKFHAPTGVFSENDTAVIR